MRIVLGVLIFLAVAQLAALGYLIARVEFLEADIASVEFNLETLRQEEQLRHPPVRFKDLPGPP